VIPSSFEACSPGNGLVFSSAVEDTARITPTDYTFGGAITIALRLKVSTHSLIGIHPLLEGTYTLLSFGGSTRDIVLKLETEDGSFTLTVDGLAEAPTYSFMTSAPRVDTRTFFDLVVTVTTAGQLAVYARASEQAK
jgi:hypothetical protein